jgi:hypothetical protein
MPFGLIPESRLPSPGIRTSGIGMRSYPPKSTVFTVSSRKNLLVERVRDDLAQGMRDAQSYKMFSMFRPNFVTGSAARGEAA